MQRERINYAFTSLVMKYGESLQALEPRLYISLVYRGFSKVRSISCS